MSEENSAVEGGQEEQAAPEPVEADATPAESKADDNGVVAGDADEARTRNWVPYEERFKPVLQERNQFRDEVERIRGENQRLHDMMYSQQQQSRSQQDYGQQGEEEDWGDPDHMARKYAQLQERLSGFELKQEAERRAASIRSDIDRQVGDLGFANPGRAKEQILQQIALSVQSSGSQNIPDIHEVARSFRQQEIEYEKEVISRYKSKKQSPEAASAQPRPSSPPVIEGRSDDKVPAWKRIQNRLRNA